MLEINYFTTIYKTILERLMILNIRIMQKLHFSIMSLTMPP